MPFTTTDRLPPFAGGPGTSSFARSRDRRVVAHALESAADALGGRTVWCVAASPAGQAVAAGLNACLGQPDEGAIAASRRRLDADAELRRLADLIDRMLAGAAAGPSGLRGLRAEERARFAAGVDDGEALLGADVRPGDVVVLHDALAAAVAEAARARGAHVVRHVTSSAHGPAVAEAWAFLRTFEHAVDAYVVTAPEPGAARSGSSRRLAAAMPAPSHVAFKDVAPPAPLDPSAAGLGWRAALADVVGEDRDEHVGGMLHARPVVAAR